MVERSSHESDVHDLSLGVIHALAMVDVKALSYVQLRRLYASLAHAIEDVEAETLRRSEKADTADTVNVRRPPERA